MTVLRAREVWAAPPGAPDPVVRGVSLDVEAGEWVALHGPNGGGKTTLALVLAGLWPARRGTVEFEGAALVPGQPPGAREGVAAVLQDPAVQLLQATVADELALAARNLGRGEEEVVREARRIAEALGLGPDLARDPHTLSAGRQQMVVLGAALAVRPRLLVADEAGAHLDAEARRRVLGVLREECARGMALVWVTQDERELAAAHRTLAVGAEGAEPEAAALPPEPDAAGADGASLMCLEIAPPGSADGPRVDVATARAIEVVGRGVTAIEGPNGAGKSVLLAVAAGALELAQVRARWRAPWSAPPLLASQYPEHQIFEERVLDEVIWAALQRGMPRDRAVAGAVRLLEALGCPSGLAGRRVWGLSGGEKRLVQLAGVLLAPADLVLLDEPTAGLDPARREAAAREVARRARSTPMLVASQDLRWLDRVGARRVRIG